MSRKVKVFTKMTKYDIIYNNLTYKGRKKK